MIDKKQLELFREKEVKIELSDETYLRGIIKSISKNSITLQLLDKRIVIITLSKLELIKEVLKCV